MSRPPNFPTPKNFADAQPGWFTCNRCGFAKHPDMFDTDNSQWNGKSAKCKECRREYQKDLKRRRREANRTINATNRVQEEYTRALEHHRRMVEAEQARIEELYGPPPSD